MVVRCGRKLLYFDHKLFSIGEQTAGLSLSRLGRARLRVEGPLCLGDAPMSDSDVVGPRGVGHPTLGRKLGLYVIDARKETFVLGEFHQIDVFALAAAAKFV